MSQVYHVIQLLLFPTRVCTRCHIEKPLDDFPKQSAKRGGYQTWCRVCMNAHRRLKRVQNLQHPQEPPTTKVCTKCHKEKPIVEFYRDNAIEGGYRASCKECCDSASGREHIGKRRKRRGIPVTPGYKWCYGCESEQPLSKFREDKTKWDNLTPRCAECRSAWQRNHWQENRWRLLPAQRLRLRAFYERDIEQSRAYNRQKRQKPQARLRMREGSRRRYARKKHAIVGEVDYARILERDGYFCHICEKPIDPRLRRGAASLDFDHVISLYHHGTHSESNIKPAHHVCNQRKGKQILEEMTPHQRRGLDA